MKRFFLLFFVFFPISLYADSQLKPNNSELEKIFVKGNIFDKIHCVQSSNGEDALFIAEKGLEFVIQNSQILQNDREHTALALASILALPQNRDFIPEDKQKNISENLLTIFKIFEDETVRIASINRLINYIKESDENLVIAMNNFVSKAIEENHQASLLIDNVINGLAVIGNKTSFHLVYTAWKKNLWPQYSADIEDSLVKLSEKSLSETLKIISSQSIKENSKFFTLLINSKNISEIFRTEIAENLLSFIINNAENLQESASDFLHLQFGSFRLLAENKWTRASRLAVENLKLSKKEFDAGLISEEQFVEVIKNSSKLSSSDVAKILSDFLSGFNGKTEKNEIPSEPVVLATIQTLGDLGDKTAFDNLLYVTYLNYSSKIKTAAKDALSKLKW